MGRINYFMLLLSLLSVHTICRAQAEKDTLRLLFVGNSYTYFENLPQIISLMSDSAKTKLVTKKSTAGGVNLRRHWYGGDGLETKELIKDGNFDIVVLQEHSMGAINEADSMRKYSKLFCDYIRKHKAKPYFYTTWAREKVPQYQEVISKVYADISAKNKAECVPVGQAWALAKKLRPNIKLFSPDGSHPSKSGAYLSACVFLGAVLNEIPDGLKSRYYTADKEGELIFLMQIDPLDVVFFKKIAEKVSLTD